MLLPSAASMPALELAARGQTPRAASLGLFPGAGVLSLGLCLGLGSLACTPSPSELGSAEPTVGDRCGDADEFARVWSGDRQVELAAALAEVPGEWPRQLLATLDARTPELGRRWTQARAHACSSPAAARCLDAQLWQLDATLAAITEEPERAAQLWRALEASHGDPGRCLQQTGEVPASDSQQGRRLAALALWAELGAEAEAAPLLASLTADPGVQAPAHALILALATARMAVAGGRLELAEEALVQAEDAATQLGAGGAGGAGSARTRVLALRAELLAARGQTDASLEARAEAVREARSAGDPWPLVAELEALAAAALERGRAEPAHAALVEAIAVAGRLAGVDDPRTAVLQARLAAAQLALGRTEAGYDALTQARDVLVVALGPDHPETLVTVEALGRLLVAAGRPGDAQLAFLDLLEIYTELYGVKDWRSARIKLELGDAAMAMDEHEAARTLYLEALTPLAQELGPTHPDVVRSSIHLGLAELALASLDAAEAACARGRDLAKGLAEGPEAATLADQAARCLREVAEQRPTAKPKPAKR
jgi:tetratricopeptide (TPR) repeat protein